MAFSVYDLLIHEADDDEAVDDVADDTTDDAGDEEGGDDNFSIDTSLEDDGESGEGGEDIPDDDGGAGDTSSSSDAGTDEEPVEANTDVFFALSKEEQQMKIKMLKNQYASLYSTCDEIIEKIDNIDTDENNVLIVSKLSETVINLKRFMLDYMVHSFPSKSFIENDIMLNRFLDIINTITISFDKLEKKIKREEEKK